LGDSEAVFEGPKIDGGEEGDFCLMIEAGSPEALRRAFSKLFGQGWMPVGGWDRLEDPDDPREFVYCAFVWRPPTSRCLGR
jgi:hypothetical protein